MKLRCKKTYYHDVPGKYGMTKERRIIEGEYYEVLQRHTNPQGERYWLFLIPDDINPKGSGFFVIDEYFETPEEKRDKIIDEILSDGNNEN